MPHGGQVNDRQTAVSQTHRTFGPHPIAIGPTVRQGGAHLPDGRGCHGLTVKSKDTGYSAHCLLLSVTPALVVAGSGELMIDKMVDDVRLLDVGHLRVEWQ
jgi:hypothetical protein